MNYYAIISHGILMHVGTKWYASQYGGPVVPVTVAEVDDNPSHWGWLGEGEDTYSMIWPTKAQFEMCFPYGSKSSEEAGKGRACKLLIEEIRP